MACFSKWITSRFLFFGTLNHFFFFFLLNNLFYLQLFKSFYMISYQHSIWQKTWELATNVSVTQTLDYYLEGFFQQLSKFSVCQIVHNEQVKKKYKKSTEWINSLCICSPPSSSFFCYFTFQIFQLSFTFSQTSCLLQVTNIWFSL